MSSDEFDHFLAAQNPVYEQVIAELSRGRKQSHWMWFIFPQLLGLGRSDMARRYALQSLAQAARYAVHVQLGRRLRQCTQMVIQAQCRSISDIFDSPDDLKFHSCMTLFTLAVPDDPLFEGALIKYFADTKDARTVELLGKAAT